MSWNYRVTQQDDEFQIREVYYVDDNPEPKGWSDPIICGTSIVDLQQEIVRLNYAFESAVLVVDENGDFR